MMKRGSEEQEEGEEEWDTSNLSKKQKTFLLRLGDTPFCAVVYAIFQIRKVGALFFSHRNTPRFCLVVLCF